MSMEISSCKKLKSSLEADDRISNLPDGVLLHILSFIPTIDSIATSILSTRWKYLWKHVPKLTFDDTQKRMTKSQNVRFANFVTKVLNVHVPKVLEKLSLRCHANCDLYDVRNWVRDSIMKNIKSLDLTIGYSEGPAVLLTSSLFKCKTLENLVLKGTNHNIIVNVPTVICLPKLKTMKLVGLKYQHDDRPSNLLSACLSLESLVVGDLKTFNDYAGFQTISSSTLKDVEFQFSPHSIIGFNQEIFCSDLRRLKLNITSYYGEKIPVPSDVFTCQTLEQLVLDGRFDITAATTICLPNLTFLALVGVLFEDDEIFSRLISSCTSLESLVIDISMKFELNISSCTLKVIELSLDYDLPGHKLVINTPALICLKLNNSEYVDYQMEDLASLEQAHVVPSSHRSSIHSYVYQALRHVKSLKVYQNYYKDSVVKHVLPVFNRLTELDIIINSWVGYDLFQELIKNSPKLENLAFLLNVEEAPRQRAWWNLNTVPACLLSSLRSVLIRSFKGREDELVMIIYILGNARIMEMMEVSFSRYFRRSKAVKRELCKKILNAPRGSEKCEVVLIN